MEVPGSGRIKPSVSFPFVVSCVLPGSSGTLPRVKNLPQCSKNPGETWPLCPENPGRMWHRRPINPGRRCPRCPKNPGRELGLAVQKSLGKSDTIGTAFGVHRLGVPASSQPQAGPKIPRTPGGSIRNPPLFHELCLPSKICPITNDQFLGAMLKGTTCSRRVQVQSSKGPRRVPEGANKGSNVSPSIIQ